jgi:hypothetical protein
MIHDIFKTDELTGEFPDGRRFPGNITSKKLKLLYFCMISRSADRNDSAPPLHAVREKYTKCIHYVKLFPLINTQVFLTSKFPFNKVILVSQEIGL